MSLELGKREGASLAREVMQGIRCSEKGCKILEDALGGVFVDGNETKRNMFIDAALLPSYTLPLPHPRGPPTDLIAAAARLFPSFRWHASFGRRTARSAKRGPQQIAAQPAISTSNERIRRHRSPGTGRTISANWPRLPRPTAANAARALRPAPSAPGGRIPGPQGGECNPRARSWRGNIHSVGCCWKWATGRYCGRFGWYKTSEDCCSATNRRISSCTAGCVT